MRSNKVTPNEFSNLPISISMGNVLHRVEFAEMITVTIDYCVSDIASASDYYPFSSLMDGRVFHGDMYLFGFNGKENYNEVKGAGGQQDYGMRIYDTRLGRFLSVVPLAKYSLHKTNF